MRTARTVASLASLLMILALSFQAMAADPPATGKGAVKGKVTYGREGVANVAVSLDGTVKKTAKTDDKGEFTFSDLPAGEYKLEAKGIAKNTTRKATATVTVLEPPQAADAVTLELK